MKKSNHKTCAVSIETIAYCKAESNYSIIYFTDEKSPLMKSMTLKTLMIKLDNPDFARCHRSFIVNIRHVKDMIKRENYRLVMENGEEIPVSEKNVGAMKKILNKKLLF